RKGGNEMIRAAIIGGSGLTGRELVKILLRHGAVEITAVTSRQYEGRKVSEVYPEFQGLTGLKYSNPSDSDVLSGIDAVFICLPHTEAMEFVKKAYDKGVKAIDLSADFRIKSAAEYKKWYNHEHKYPQLLKKAVYGQPELYRKEIESALILANAGCHATATILGIAPAVSSFGVESVISDSKTGISGAGAKPTETNTYMNISENIIPYSFGRRHRHIGEIEDVMKHRFGKEIRAILTPQITSLDRGIVATIYMKLKKWPGLEKAKKVYSDFYAGEPFIRIVESINLHAVQNTNFCNVLVDGVEEENMLIVITAIDNLVKGASGQAVQNMNIMFGFDERGGLL
ncbi:MAG TPA: N-acetyl-gamma-glutamyl-phosphate reductase, partial [Candidatus Goldiibacteriota bacterium]|nr:N-acetyl-gamma-glutamyl-phosphate reductase [Candidatus Goldiibacteriota bacterium]